MQDQTVILFYHCVATSSTTYMDIKRQLQSLTAVIFKSFICDTLYYGIVSRKKCTLLHYFFVKLWDSTIQFIHLIISLHFSSQQGVISLTARVMKPTTFKLESVCVLLESVTGSWSAWVESQLQMACYVKGFCSLELTTAAGSPLGKTGNDSTSQLPVQTGNRDVSWQSPSSLQDPPPPPAPINVSHFLSWSHLDQGRKGGVNCCVLDRKYKVKDP